MRCTNPNCYNETKPLSHGKGFKKYCSTYCQNLGRVKNMKDTFQERYGKEWVLNLPDDEQTEAREYLITHAPTAQK